MAARLLTIQPESVVIEIAVSKYPVVRPDLAYKTRKGFIREIESEEQELQNG
jgi:hypothetical protein